MLQKVAGNENDLERNYENENINSYGKSISYYFSWSKFKGISHATIFNYWFLLGAALISLVVFYISKKFNKNRTVTISLL